MAHRRFHSFSNEDALTRAIATGAREAGIYTIPGGLEGGSGEQQKATAEKIAKGPFLFAAVRPGAMGSITAMYVRQMLIQLVTAFVLSLLLLRAAPMGFSRRVWFVAGVGLAGAIAGHLPDWNWWGFGPGYTAVAVADMVIGFALAGCAIAAFLPTASESRQPAAKQHVRNAAAS